MNDDMVDPLPWFETVPIRHDCIVVTLNGDQPTALRVPLRSCQLYAIEIRKENPFIQVWIRDQRGKWLIGDWQYATQTYCWYDRASTSIPAVVLMAEVLTQ